MKDAVNGSRRLDAEDRVVRAVFVVVTEVVALADPPAVVSSASIISDCCLCAAFACCSARRCRRAHLDSYAASASAGVRSALMYILVRTKLFSDCLSDLAFLIKNDASSAEDSPTSIGLFCVRSALPSRLHAVFHCYMFSKFVINHSGHHVLLITIIGDLQARDDDIVRSPLLFLQV